MPSEFDTLAREFVAPFAAEHFGERAADGTLAEAKMLRRSAPLEVILAGVVVGPVQVAEVEKENGDIAKRETVTLTFRTPAQVERIERSARFIIPETGEGNWVPQPSGHKLGPVWTTYELERQPLAEMDTKRDARTV